MDDVSGGATESRREALKKLGLGAAGAAAVWSTPAVLSLDAAAAATKLPPVFVAATPAVAANAGVLTFSDSVTTAAMTLQNNDIVLALAVWNDGTDVTAPAGWTQIFATDIIAETVADFSLRTNVWWQRVAGDLPPQTWNRNLFANNGGPFRVQQVAYRGAVTTGTPFDAPPTPTQSGNSNVTTKAFPAVTTLGPARQIVYLGAAGRFNSASNYLEWIAPNPGATVRVQSTGAASSNAAPNYRGSRAIHVSDWGQMAAGTRPSVDGTLRRNPNLTESRAYVGIAIPLIPQ